MKLQDKMAAYKRNFVKKAPPEALAVMQGAKDALRNSGILERAVKVGDQAPDFALIHTDGRRLTLADMLDRDWLVLGFYRGRW
jgi:hypothetical protein